MSMPRVRFESTIPASELAKTVHALDRAATVIAILHNIYGNKTECMEIVSKYTW
jgi:hypothetical protein